MADEEGAAKGHPGVPLAHVKKPETRTASALIRWALEMGYEVKEISSTWGFRYQQVRNVKMTEPKRAAREDIPPLVLELVNPVDDVEAILDGMLDASLAEMRQGTKAKKQGGRRD